jgi:hypothetical protein
VVIRFSKSEGVPPQTLINNPTGRREGSYRPNIIKPQEPLMNEDIEALLSDSAIIETENDDGTTITLIDGTITPKCSFSDEWTENNN